MYYIYNIHSIQLILSLSAFGIKKKQPAVALCIFRSIDSRNRFRKFSVAIFFESVAIFQAKNGCLRSEVKK